MSDNYDAVYQAVRSKISGCDVGDAIQSSIRDMNLSHYFERASQEWTVAASEQQRPFVLLRPKMFKDGNLWCALYGGNIQDGVAGFGKSPALAAGDFDKNWYLTT